MTCLKHGKPLNSKNNIPQKRKMKNQDLVIVNVQDISESAPLEQKVTNETYVFAVTEPTEDANTLYTSQTLDASKSKERSTNFAHI